MHLTIFPKRVALLLICIALCLSVVSIVGQFCLYFFCLEQFSALINLFDVDREHNVPSFYSGFLLLFNALLLSAIASVKKRSRDRYTLHWQGLSIIFFYLSVDEWFSVHETINTFINQTGKMSGGKQWDILNSFLLIIFSFAYFKFFFHLPKQLRKLFFISAFLFVVGALGIELISSNFFAYIYNQPRFVSEIIITIEEFLEMSGAAIFSCALLMQIFHLPIHNISIEIK